jgi:hypothetical protein
MAKLSRIFVDTGVPPFNALHYGKVGWCGQISGGRRGAAMLIAMIAGIRPVATL